MSDRIRLDFCRNLVQFICDFTKNNRLYFYLTILLISAFDMFEGGLFSLKTVLTDRNPINVWHTFCVD